MGLSWLDIKCIKEQYPRAGWNTQHQINIKWNEHPPLQDIVVLFASLVNISSFLLKIPNNTSPVITSVRHSYAINILACSNQWLTKRQYWANQNFQQCKFNFYDENKW